jgi:feruloyl esterase
MMTRKFRQALRLTAAIGMIAAAVFFAGPPAATASDPGQEWAGACEGLMGTRGDVVVVRASAIVPSPTYLPETRSFYRSVPVSVPFCRVEGTIEGNIGFELWLPKDWNQRLLGAGVGGDAGVYNYVDMSVRLTQGFAAITTDSGHKIDEAHWMLDAKKRADYEHRAVHLSAVAAKSLLAHFYGREADRAYFTGCSGGGRQALKEMQNYPGDYDGVIAGAPAPNMPMQSVRMLWFSLEQQRNPSGALSDGDWALYENKVTQACDGNDRVLDGIVENPAACRFDTSMLACKPGQESGCIKDAPLAMLNQIVSPMVGEDGSRMDSGLFPGVRTRPGPPPSLLKSMWADGVHNDPTWDEMTFHRQNDLALTDEVMPELRADKTAIEPFIERGNKAIIYQGWQDPSTNAGHAIDYYAKLVRLHGGLDTLSKSVRLFMVPGMYHCGGGPGADSFGASMHLPIPSDDDRSRDILWSLIRWVEDGIAPDSIVAAKDVVGDAGFTRTLCPFPKLAVYDGKGPTAVASSYRCETDPTLVKLLSSGD